MPTGAEKRDPPADDNIGIAAFGAGIAGATVIARFVRDDRLWCGDLLVIEAGIDARPAFAVVLDFGFEITLNDAERFQVL